MIIISDFSMFDFTKSYAINDNDVMCWKYGNEINWHEMTPQELTTMIRSLQVTLDAKNKEIADLRGEKCLRCVDGAQPAQTA